MIKSSRHNIGCVNNKLLCKTFPDFAIKVLCFLTTINMTFKFQLMVHKKLSWRICKCPVDLWQPGQIVLKKFHPSKNPDPICDPSPIITTRQLNALTVPWSHNVSNNCIYIHSYLLRWYKLNCNQFNHCERPIFFSSQHRPPAQGHQRQSGCHFFLLWSGDCAMTLAFHVLQKICSMKIFIKFICTFRRNISLPLQ